jgi:hypothetical protein
MSLTSLRVLSHEYTGGREERLEIAKEEITSPVSGLLLALLVFVFSVIAALAMIAYPEIFVPTNELGIPPL